MSEPTGPRDELEFTDDPREYSRDCRPVGSPVLGLMLRRCRVVASAKTVASRSFRAWLVEALWPKIRPPARVVVVVRERPTCTHPAHRLDHGLLVCAHHECGSPLGALASTCPFCRRDDLLTIEPRPEGGFLGVRCRACGCVGPSKLSTDDFEAIAHWNARAT